MTLASSTRSVTYHGNGVTTVFPYAFWIQKLEDLQVSLITVATGVAEDVTADITSVTGISPDPSAGGDVTYDLLGVPISSAYDLVIARTVDYTQDLDIRNQDGFLPDTLESELDRIVMQTQQLGDDAARSLRVPIGQDVTSVVDHVYVTDGYGTMKDGGVLSQAAAATSAAEAAVSAAAALVSQSAAAVSAAAALVSQGAAATSAGTATTQAGLAAASAAAAIANQAAPGRLSLTSAVSVPSGDVVGGATLYYVPHIGNSIALYDGALWHSRSIGTQISLLLTGLLTNARPHDVWIYDNAGTPTLEVLAWTNDTTRATALVRQDGILSKTGALTRRYVGTIYATGTGTTEDSKAKRYVWNMDNRVPRSMKSADEAAASWNYTTATIRQANANVANQVDFVRGLDEGAVVCSTLSGATNATASTVYRIGIGLDSTTTFSADCLPGFGASYSSIWAQYVGAPGLGKHSLMWNEISAVGGTTTWQGTSAGLQQIGMRGTITL